MRESQANIEGQNQSKETIIKDDKGLPFSHEGKLRFYDNELSMIKAQILELILVQPELSAKFMKQYNEFLRKIEQDGVVSVNLMREISDFKEELSKAKEEISEEKDTVVFAFKNKCKELIDSLSVKQVREIEEEWNRLRKKLDSGEIKCTLKQKSEIQNLLSTLHFFIITEKIRGNQEIDLKSEIPETETGEMLSVIYYQLSRLCNSKYSVDSELGNSIKTDITLYAGASTSGELVYDRKIWEQFAKEGIIRVDKSQISIVNNLPTAVKKKPSFFERIGRMAKMIVSSEIDKMAGQGVTDERLRKVAEDLLMKRFGECDVKMLERYLQVADRRLPVYVLLRQIKEKKDVDVLEFDFLQSPKRQYNCHISKEEGENEKFIIRNNLGQAIKFQLYSYYEGSGGALYSHIANIIELFNVAEFLNKQEGMKETIINFATSNDSKHPSEEELYNQKLIRKIEQRLRRALTEYDQTQFDFFLDEYEKMDMVRGVRQKFLAENKSDVNPVSINHERKPNEVPDREI